MTTYPLGGRPTPVRQGHRTPLAAPHRPAPVTALGAPVRSLLRIGPKGFLPRCFMYLRPHFTDTLYNGSCYRQLKGSLNINTEEQDQREQTVMGIKVSLYILSKSWLFKIRLRGWPGAFQGPRAEGSVSRCVIHAAPESCSSVPGAICSPSPAPQNRWALCSLNEARALGGQLPSSPELASTPVLKPQD